MDFNSVKSKVVIVTGTSSGIGLAIAKLYATHGMHVICADINKEKGQHAVDDICKDGASAIFMHTDCSDPAQIKKLVDFALIQYGKLDGIVNNAGIGQGGTPLHEYSIEDYEKVFNINSKGVFAGMKYATKAILQSKSEGGFIINIASVAGVVSQKGQSLFTATKAGIVGLTKAAALDYAQHGITVNAICPGYTQTNIFGNAPTQALQYFANNCPAKRLGTPEECAYMALFLASDMARYINGAIIPIDGALSAGHENVCTWQHLEILD